MIDSVRIYTDGACRGNPGPGGWGVLLQFGSNEKELWGGERETTNNRMEMMAAIKGLESLKKTCRVMMFTDSKYLLRGITEWMPGWKKRGWITASKKPVKNDDLWKSLDILIQNHEIDWTWVRGHSGHPGNERADQLANRGIDSLEN